MLADEEARRNFATVVANYDYAERWVRRNLDRYHTDGSVALGHENHEGPVGGDGAPRAQKVGAV